MKKRKIILTSLALALVLVIGGIAAYLTDTTSEVTNTFTVGKVDIDLTEPTWDQNVQADSNYAKNIVPGQTIAKDPTITVKSDSKAAYIFMKVTVPTGTVNTVANTELFTYTLNSGWVEVTDSSLPANVHVYAYGSSTAMTSVAAGTSQTLFNNVVFTSAIKGSEAAALTGNQEIKVQGYAIQADNLSSADPTTVWGMVKSA